MADDAREYLRAAQEAETQGDDARAVALLRKAAAVYRGRGQTARALQMLRHARRLDGSNQGLADEISRMEWLPEEPLARAVMGEPAIEPSDELKLELAKLLEPLEPTNELPGARAQLFERGPTRADPTLNAWCSFCCKPKKEVGDLVAGPAGAFVCGGCVAESARLLGLPPVAASTPTEAVNPAEPAAPPPALQRVDAPDEPTPARAAPRSVLEAKRARAPEKREPLAARAQVPFFGQAQAALAVDLALQRGARLVVVVGPEGTGKSAYLADLERRGVGARGGVEDRVEGALLLDGFDQLSATQRELFAERCEQEPELRAVLSLRANAPVEPLMLVSEDGPLVLHPTSSILSALGAAVPPRLADRVDLLAVFEPLSDAELRELAHGLVERRAAELDLSEELIGQLAAAAARSGRGGRELEALIRRIPAGSWSLAPASAPAAEAQPKPKPKRSRKKQA